MALASMYIASLAYLRDVSWYDNGRGYSRGSPKFHALGDEPGSKCGCVRILDESTGQPPETLPAILLCKRCFPNMTNH